MKNTDSISHLQGKSIYIDDIPVIEGTLYGLVFDSQNAHAKIINVDYSEALKLYGVVDILTYKDVPGRNQIGAIIEDEPLFAENEVHFMGQPIAFIIAQSEFIARKARKLIKIEFESKKVITNPREAFENNSFITNHRTFRIGDVNSAWENCKYIISGNAKSGGQEHLYLETQGAYAVPTEKGNIKIYSSTQGPTSVQKITARVLGVSMNKIEIDVTRLGGGFGGKEDQATPWAVMTALAAQKHNRPVKYSLNRHDDMRMTGKRHPYDSDFKIGLSDDLKIIAYEADFYQNSGAAADLSTAITERTLFHATNSYFIPNTRTTVYLCKTNLPPNTAFRGFGAPQGMFVIEAAINKAASEIGVSVEEIQKKNLIKINDEFPYGQKADENGAINSWETADNTYQFKKLFAEVEKYNSENKYQKKGISVMPVTFGISFTNTMMNHARALVHIYQDGSVGISTGAIEMGQAVNTKIMQVAASVLNISTERIKIETTNTTRVANTSPTAASSGADLNGKATEVACNALYKRLTEFAAKHLNIEEKNIRIKNETIYIDEKQSDLKWEKLIEQAFFARIALSENGHYATPEINFDKTKEKGHPFAYHVFGNAVTTISLDCIRGTYEIDSVKIVHDFGKSINPLIDNGQNEGALMQGIAWVTMEEIAFNEEGKLLSNALSTYKVPDIYFAPKQVEIKHLEIDGHKFAIMKSKAVGEPPFNYGIGAYFAIQNAIKAFNPNYKTEYNAPATPEKVLMSLYE